MPLPEIQFSSEEEQLKYGTKVLMEAGFSPQQIENIRERVGLGPNKIPYNKELTGMRRYMVQELLAANLSNRQIAQVLKLSKETINADRHHNRNLWTAQILQSQDAWRARLIKEQQELKEQAIEGFLNSKRKVITTTKGNDSIVRVEESAGESGFLGVARSCLEQQAKLIGLFDVKPQAEEKNGYKAFLDNLSKEVKKIKEAESNSEIRMTAIEAVAEFDADGEPTGASRPLLSANGENEDEPSL